MFEQIQLDSYLFSQWSADIKIVVDTSEAA